jgi:arginine/ornithine N-succinyltransferase beta subunit
LEFLYEDGLDVNSLIDVFEAVVTVECSMTRLAAREYLTKRAVELRLPGQIYRQRLCGLGQGIHLLISRIAKSSLLYRIVIRYGS